MQTKLCERRRGVLPLRLYLKSLLSDMSLSLSFFMTLATAISKSSCVTWTRRSRNAYIPASVQTACAHNATAELGCKHHYVCYDVARA